jgi:hypothetical protein
MGFRKTSLDHTERTISEILAEIHSPYNDGFVQSSCKRDLYMLKCWLEDEYSRLPTFVGEERWEQERIVKILKQE